MDVGDAWINHVGWDQEIGEDEDAEEEMVLAESMSLFLPSYLSEADRQRVGLNEVAKQELELRKGQANDCLEAIRTTLGQKADLRGQRSVFELSETTVTLKLILPSCDMPKVSLHIPGHGARWRAWMRR